MRTKVGISRRISPLKRTTNSSSLISDRYPAILNSPHSVGKFATATRSTERPAVCSEHVAIEESINELSLPNAVALRVLQNSLWVSRVGFGRPNYRSKRRPLQAIEPPFSG